MALNSRPIIHPDWLTHNRGPDKSLMLVELEIFDPNSSTSTYDAETNSWTSDRQVVFTGKGRIQPVRTASNRSNMTNPTSIQEVQVHIDFAGNTLEGYQELGGLVPDIRPGYQIFVTDSPYDRELETYILNVRASVNSSNPWHRVIYCEIDQEVLRVTGT